jgi:molybdate-binding protein/DNA-binding transcriptional regulator YhcF (GntR family)
MTIAIEPPHSFRGIADEIVRQIAVGDLKPGSRLPPVREAALLWGVNLNTVHRAYAHLAAQGIVDTNAGGGTRVATYSVDSVAAARGERLRMLMGTSIANALGLGFGPEEVEAVVVGQLAQWRESRRPRTASSTNRPVPSPRDRLRIGGSHDLSLELLVAEMRGRPRSIEVEIEPSSSLEGLFDLARGSCDVAGCHLLDVESGDYNAPYVRRVLPGQPVDLVTLAEREQGLMVAAGNPRNIRSITDLTRPDVRFVNRPRGSGTRVLLDWLLVEAGADAATIRGYDDEEATHLGVAAAVAEGRAVTGLGIRAAAQALGLAFFPLAKERYELATIPSRETRPPLRQLLDTLRDPDFLAAMRALTGYDTHESGRTRRVDP